MPRERKRKRKGRERYWDQVRELADEHGWSTTEARAQWSRFYKKGGKKRKNPRPEPVDPQVIIDAAPEEGPVCPYCRVGFLPDERTSVCPGCQTRLHHECRMELRRCPTLGCAGGRATQNAAQPREGITIRIDGGQLAETRRRRVFRAIAIGSAIGITLVAVVVAIIQAIYG